MTHPISRRVAIGSIAASAIIAKAAAAADQQSGRVRASFLRKLERVRRLDAAHDRLHEQEYVPAHAAYTQAAAKVPHVEIESGCSNHQGKPIVLSTASQTNVAVAMSLLEKPVSDEKYMDACRRLVDAVQDRGAVIRALREKSGLGAAIDRSNRLGDLQSQAEWSFIRSRVTSIHELKLKLDFMIERHAFDCDDAPAEIAADVSALAMAA